MPSLNFRTLFLIQIFLGKLTVKKKKKIFFFYQNSFSYRDSLVSLGGIGKTAGKHDGGVGGG